MSLVGSLEDLGLVDILQIVSLSRKSGMLMLRSESGDGRIALCDGLVRGAAIKGEVEDLRGLLIAEGCLDAASFDRARELAGGESLEIDEALARACGVEPEALGRMRRAHVERVVMRMFGWRTGEFSFEIRDDLPAEDRELLLPSGLNTQYLAMEATRLGDEARTEEHDVGEDAVVFSGESPETGSATDALALATAGAVDAATEVDCFEEAPSAEPVQAAAPEAGGDPAECEVSIEAGHAGDTRVPVSVSPRELRAASGTLIAVDANLSTLEWMKASVGELVSRVHIFQRRDAALVRIRQYLSRGIVPIVVFADGQADRRGPDAANFNGRLRALAPSMPILLLRPGSASDPLPAETDGALVRPGSPSSDPDRWHLDEPIAERLRADLAPWLQGEGAVIARRRARGALARLKCASDRLRDPATQGEVLTLVLDFAAQTFGRVAMFMLRDDVATGMAQRGMPSAGGPDDAAICALCFGVDEMPALFREVLEQAAPVHRAPRDDDRGLAGALGDAMPAELYAAPIESGGSVVALVYADGLPDARPLPDTTAFEIVLHEAGLVLDRTVLERALAERA